MVEKPNLRKSEPTESETSASESAGAASAETVKVYTRHKVSCAKRDRPDWARCNCVKWLYVHRNGKDQRFSAKTRSWEKAERKAREIRDSFDDTKRLARELEAKLKAGNEQIEISSAVAEFLKEVSRLDRAEATQSKYKLTLNRLLKWCGAQQPLLLCLRQLDVPTLRAWVSSWGGAPTTRHNQQQRVRAFFRFSVDQGWMPDNPAKKIKNVNPDQEETLPFSREQYEALIEATYCYDARGKEPNGNTANSRRVRAYLQLLRWSGLRAGDAACMEKSKLRDDDSLFLRQAKVKGRASAPVYVLLPPEVANDLRNAPPGSVTHPNYFFWSGQSKRKSEVSNWEKIFGKVRSKAAELHPKLFLETDGRAKPAHLHMLRDTFAVEYLLAGMPLEEVSRLLGHASILVTQKHYAPWVTERQRRLEASQRMAWKEMGIGQSPNAAPKTRNRPRIFLKLPGRNPLLARRVQFRSR
jgi:site-specific recombinase XerD